MLQRLRFLPFLLSFIAACANSHGVGDVEPVAQLCCEEACADGLDGNICGVSACADTLAPTCRSLDLVSEECTVLYSNCDEGGDCPAGEVCRPAELGGNYYACREPIEHFCDYPDTLQPGCRYACRSDADCPPGAPTCTFNTPIAGPCSDVGFCWY